MVRGRGSNPSSMSLASPDSFLLCSCLSKQTKALVQINSGSGSQSVVLSLDQQHQYHLGAC